MTLPSPQAMQSQGPSREGGLPQTRNGLARISMVLGIGAFVASIVAYPAMPLGPRWAIPGIILGVSAVILGLVAIARARRERISNKRMAIAGLVTGIVGAVVATFLLVVITRLTSECQDGAVMDEYHAVTLEGCIENKLAD